MEEYYFLFALTFIWMVFAIVQDLRTREVSNWLNFSLISFVLAYRGFYAIFSKDVWFFLYGLFGVFFFVVLAYIFYYGRVFAGGDAKLLMGIGGIIPYSSFGDYFILGLGFIFLLFASGVVYSLAYSVFLVKRNFGKFKLEFVRQARKNRGWFYLVILFVVLFGVIFWKFGTLRYGFSYIILLFLFPLLYYYVKALENSCMVVLKNPKDLTEGEWLERDVRIGRRTIKKSVHGLSKKDIILLRKAKKRVMIKEGIPFTPAFLFALLIGIWFLRNSSIQFY